MKGVAAIVAAKLAIHLAAIRGYGLHGDELYYLACADHLGLGYVDHPPLAVWILAGVREVLGSSAPALRAVPILTGAATVWLAGRMARELGGGGFAATLAAAAVLVSGVHLAIHGIYSVNAFDLLFWAVAQLLVIRLAKDDTPRRWAALGLVVGLGLLTKLSMAWFALGLAAGVLLTPARAWLRRPAPWAAAGLALLLVSPYLVWQAQHGWPTLAWFARREELVTGGTLLGFLGNQILAVHPLNVPIWAAGLVALLAAPGLRRFRVLGVQAVVVLAFLAWRAPAVVHYPAAVYPVLFAAGAWVLERATAAGWRRWLRPAALGLLLLAGVLGAPLALPLLPEEEVVPYTVEIGFEAPEAYGRAHHAFPQQFSTMLAWEEVARATARAWHALPEAERARTAIVGASYSDAGAIDHFGPALGLPRAVSGHLSYGLWGRRGHDLEQVLFVGAPPERLAPWWRERRVVATVACPRCEPWRQEIHIVRARGARQPPDALWESLRHD